MATNSRYDFMEPGQTPDEVNGSMYPDPLTLNYNRFQMTELPAKNNLTSLDIIYLWKESQDYYGKACWDDMVLTLNGIPHRNFLEPGDALYYPTESDIISSFNKTR